MTQLNLEATILTNLIYNSEYTRKVIPYIKGRIFPRHHSKSGVSNY